MRTCRRRRRPRRPTSTSPQTSTAEGQTGYVWTFLDEARDPSIIVPGELVVVGDADASAVAVVIDLAPHPNGTIVHLDVLPGAVDSHLALARRAATAS